MQEAVFVQASGDIKNDPVLREAMLALRIAHPNLVATYRANVRTLEDTAVPGGGGQQQFQITGDITPSYQLFLLQEFCDSGTLYDWLSRERMHPGNTPDQVRVSTPRTLKTEQETNLSLRLFNTSFNTSVDSLWCSYAFTVVFTVVYEGIWGRGFSTNFAWFDTGILIVANDDFRRLIERFAALEPVSYTHLTLPTTP